MSNAEKVSIDKEAFFKHKTAGLLMNIRKGAGIWLAPTEITKEIYKNACLLTDLINNYVGYKDGLKLVQDINILCMSLPDDGQKYTAILKRDAKKIVDVYYNIDELIKQAYLNL